MVIRDIGIIGMGLWEGPAITNDYFGERYVKSAQVKDPYRGRRSDDGTIRIAGMEFSKEKHARALAAIERSYQDPFRGTRRRRHFPSDLKVSDAETEAAQKAIADAGLAPSDIDALFVQSFLPDELQPKNAALVAHKLGIRRAPAWEIDSICNSAITHLCIGGSLIMSGFARHVLCVQSTAYSRVSDPGVSSTVAEADMASAFVIGPSPGTQMAPSFRTDGRLHGAIKLHWGTPVESPPRLYWQRSQEALLIKFNQEMQEQLLGELEHYTRIVCDEALEAVNMRRDEIDIFIAHQPMSWNRALMEDILELADGTAFDTFEEYASINSVGIPASIHEACRIGRIQKGKDVLLFGPSAGYTYAAMAVRW